MLREQMLRCQEYKREGETALGPIVSLLSAIKDEKKAERETAELVIRAQQETLSRLNSNVFIQFLVFFFFLINYHIFYKFKMHILKICILFRTTARTYRAGRAT